MPPRTVIKSIGKRKGKKHNTKGRRSNGQIVLAQGTGRSVNKAFGTQRVPRGIGLPAGSWDAFSSSHAALPRAVGPYTVVRTSSLLDTTSRFALIGTSRPADFGVNDWWSNTVLATEEGTGLIGTSPSSAFQVVTAPGGSVDGGAYNSTFTCCPAAISVQVMGSASLQLATGNVAAAVIPAQIDLFKSGRTWGELEQEFVSFFRPRLMSAGKLSLRGVQLDSFPLSMADCSEFLPMRVSTNLGSTANPVEWNTGDTPRFKGWAPMAIYNPQNVPLTLLVTVEWRVRFDITNPAVSSHSHHGVSTDHAWEQSLRKAHSALPGVIDIVEKVANSGLSLYGAARAAGALG